MREHVIEHPAVVPHVAAYVLGLKIHAHQIIQSLFADGFRTVSINQDPRTNAIVVKGENKCAAS